MATGRGPELAGVLGLFFGLSWIFFSLRMFVKTFLTKSWGVDDLLLIISIILHTTTCICSALAVKYGVGRYAIDIPIGNIPRALYFWWLCEIFYSLSTVLIRLSISVFLIRICLRRIYKIIIYVTVAIVLIFSTFYVFLILFQCSPVDFFWNQYKGEKGHCINPAYITNATIAHSAISFTADWVFGFLPIALIWNLQLNKRTKISIAGVLSLGLLAGVATIIRIPYIKVLTRTDEVLFATTGLAICSTIEPGLGIIAASAYTLRPLFRSLYVLLSRLASRCSGASRGDCTQNTYNCTRRTGTNSCEAPDPNHGILLRPNPVKANSSVAGARSPFGDSNEDVNQLNDAGGQGVIQVHKTFGITRGNDDSIRSAHNTPWQGPESSWSFVSTALK